MPAIEIVADYPRPPRIELVRLFPFASLEWIAADVKYHLRDLPPTHHLHRSGGIS